MRLHVYLRDGGGFVGSSGLHRIDWTVPRFEIGYWIRTSMTGHGFATEATRRIADFAFDELGAERVEIWCDAANERSAAVAVRAGFELEARLAPQPPGRGWRAHRLALLCEASISPLPKLERGIRKINGSAILAES